MAVASRKTGKYTTTNISRMESMDYVRVLYVNVEEIEDKVNLCINNHDDSDVVDIKLSECQDKTVVLIHFKKKETENG